MQLIQLQAQIKRYKINKKSCGKNYCLVSDLGYWKTSNRIISCSLLKAILRYHKIRESAIPQHVPVLLIVKSLLMVRMGGALFQ